jgi:ketosteroid isomerase-like protein
LIFYNFNKVTETISQDIIKEIKSDHEKLTEYSEKAQLDSFLSYYDNSSLFLQISSDGKMRNYEEFKNICTEYYNMLKEQKISTIFEKLNVIDNNLAILSWTGNIIAQFRNGDTMKMKNYSITNVFKRIEGKWKIIHSHESALPPEIIKKG